MLIGLALRSEGPLSAGHLAAATAPLWEKERKKDKSSGWNIRHPKWAAGHGGISDKIHKVTNWKQNNDRLILNEAVRKREAGMLGKICLITLHR